MFKNFQKRYCLSDKGIWGLKMGALWVAITNLATMAGMTALFLLMADFINHLTASADLPQLLPYAIALIVFFAMLFISNWQQYNYTYGVFYEECGNQRISIAEHLRKLPLSFFGKRDLADLTETIMGDVQTMEHAYSHVLGELYGAIISSTIVFIGCLFFNWQLAIAAFWSVPVAIGILFATRVPLEPLIRKNRDRAVNVSEGIQEMLDCVREIRATNQEDAYLSTLNRKVDEAEKASIGAEFVNGAIVNLAFVTLRIGIATTLVVGATLVASGSIDFLTMFAFLLVVSRIYSPFDQSLQLISELFMSRNSARRMTEILNEPIATGSEEFAPANHDIVFDGVSFGYDATPAPEVCSRGTGADPADSLTEPVVVPLTANPSGTASSSTAEVCSKPRTSELVLNNVSFTAKQGEVTALVGPSGSGKSTCSRLAARFWDATSGTVSVGGIDVASVDPEVLLRDYSIVFQDVLLFDDTVMGNIRLGKRDASDEEVLAAAKAANCDEFVSKMPEGYNTMIGENGSRLSGGERQRISIARALLKDAPIVLLDEATASLDVENETQVQEALSRLLVGKTVLVIAHRMRTIQAADHVVVLKGGTIAEQGSPSELLAANGEFAKMVALQSASATWSL